MNLIKLLLNRPYSRRFWTNLSNSYEALNLIKPMELSLAVFGLRRSGIHAITEYIMIGKSWRLYNNLNPSDIDDWGLPWKANRITDYGESNPQNCVGIFEDYPFHEVRKVLMYWKPEKVVMVLRDPFNWIASRISVKYRIWPDHWISYAAALNNQSLHDSVIGEFQYIDYNKYLKSKCWSDKWADYGGSSVFQKQEGSINRHRLLKRYIELNETQRIVFIKAIRQSSPTLLDMASKLYPIETREAIDCIPELGMKYH